MADIHDMTGAKVDVEAPDPDRVLRTLKELVADIEGGKVAPTDVYLTWEQQLGDGTVRFGSRDSGLTVSEGVFWLEREKLQLFRMQGHFK